MPAADKDRNWEKGNGKGSAEVGGKGGLGRERGKLSLGSMPGTLDSPQPLSDPFRANSSMLSDAKLML